MAEFTDVGQHCSDPYCRQQDFLPFACDACGKAFCLAHRSYRDHDCPCGQVGRDVTAIVCPLCNGSIKIVDNSLDAEALAWERHVATACTRKKPPAIPKCPVDGCKEKLTFSNSVTCTKCGTKVCLKHRYEEDHKCGRPARAVARSATPLVKQGNRKRVQPPVRPVPKPAQPPVRSVSKPAREDGKKVGQQCCVIS